MILMEDKSVIDKKCRLNYRLKSVEKKQEN